VEECLMPLVQYLIPFIPVDERATLLTRCVIRAMHNGSYPIYEACGAVLMNDTPTTGKLFADSCILGDERRLFLSRTLDILDWDPSVCRSLMNELLVASINDVDTWLHVCGDPYLTVWNTTSPARLHAGVVRFATVVERDEIKLRVIMEHVPVGTHLEARESLTHAGGNIVEAIMYMTAKHPMYIV